MDILWAAREEIGEIASFLHECWNAAYAHNISPEDLASLSVDIRRESLFSRWDRQGSDFLVMRNNGQMIGTAICGKSATAGDPDDGELTAIYLSPDSIGKGYGHALITRTEEYFTEKKCRYFILDVLKENSRAIHSSGHI
ncbi:MAG: GNAT family N-acetyltransferase [Oscillospiraceae bacterium]|jgi:ribosomal protein S18 acetylase RimI-like enzyme|nr:GNAT family N-acetyltransferase [Oscillospiraceae bacterium]